MHLKDIGEEMAVRQLQIREANGTVQNVYIRIGKPLQFPDSTDYFVPYRLEGFGIEGVRWGAGIDAVQAIQLTMSMIGSELEAFRRSITAKVSWIGGQNGELGFPIAASEKG